MSGFMTKIRIFSYKVENNTNLDIQGDALGKQSHRTTIFVKY